MKQIIQRYITMNPKLEVSKDLKIIMSSLTRTNENNFTRRLNNWHKNKKYKHLNIQNTTNSIESGIFSHMKNMISLHRGVTKEKKLLLVDFYLMNLGKK